ncbi:MAG: FKBP-type peptidyl-prolyl cis-trans isomerase [Alcanivoracaceae bacterium]|nr:FKBP-type peptidyl-prolyl cis-trans isomerase [Alcanivoracaceae bacterium]
MNFKLNFKLFLAVAVLITATITSAQDKTITFDKKKTSYAIGYQMGIEFLGRQGSEFELDVEEAINAIRDAYAKKDPAVSKEDMVLNYKSYENKMKQKQFEAYKKLAEENKKRSDNFLIDNRKKKGIKELASGIQYRIIEDGTGNHPTLDSEVTIHYRGSLIGMKDVNNYQEFDSSFVRGKPKKLKVNSVLKGWQEIIPLMRPGGKWQVFIPPELAYGVRGQPPIGPNEILIFDINLLSIDL